MEPIIYRLKEARTMKGQSLRQAAKGLQMSHTNLDKWEKGLIGMDSTNLIMFANYYGVTVDYLVTNPHRPTVVLTDVRFFKNLRNT